MRNKQVLLFSLLFSMYHFVIHLILGVYEFYQISFSPLAMLGIQTLIVLLFQLFIELIITKLKNKLILTKALTYTLSSLLSALFLFFLVSVYREYYLPYFSAFLITGTVYSLFYFSIYFLNSLKKNSAVLSIDQTAKNNENEEIEVFNLTDSKGKMRLSVELKMIICFEANDNYVNIYFEDASQNLVKKLERISMKRIEEFIGDNKKEFLRIHKSFIINTNYITQVIGKAQAQKVRLKHLNEELPVSRKINITDYLN